MPKTQSIVMIDCQVAGVSGDMLLGALIDLGADTKKVIQAIKSLENPSNGYENVEVEIKKVEKRGFRATKIDVTAKTTYRMKGNDLIEIVEKTAADLNLSKKAREFTSKTIRTLINTESKIHENDLAEVHIHEVGEIDTAAEIIGCAVALDDLKLFDAKIYSTPVSVGGGLFKFSHGTVASPSPATLAIFQSKNFPMKGGPVESELATPTGASILISLVDEVSVFYPPMAPLKTGYGAGNKDFNETPNILRITMGKALDDGFLEDEVAVLETNLDDATGEIIGYTIEKLLQAGAKDVSAIPMFTKKNRPGQILKIVADKKDARKLSRILIEETGTLGVRICLCQRLILERETLRIDIQLDSGTEQVKVKIAKDSSGAIVRIKPEYDDLKKIAEKTNKPLRQIAELAIIKARETLQER